jgi:hypothetical protein
MTITVNTPNGLQLQAEVIRPGKDCNLCILQDRLILVNTEGHILYQRDLLEMYPELIS